MTPTGEIANEGRGAKYRQGVKSNFCREQKVFVMP